jgi:methylated-DNA-[protein]-cysteine S-methyltransferase
VRVTRHRYVVDGWGTGEVVVSEGTVLLHELPGSVPPGVDAPPAAAVTGTATESGPPAPEGDASPPALTLAGEPARVCAGFEPKLLDAGFQLADGGAPVAAELARRARAHLAGRVTRYDDVPLDLSWCTEFQQDLAAALRAVPWGEVVSYGELAALAGRPGAARAAGSFCAQNRFALAVPCHRVVGSTGIGGYGSAGVGLKRRLLALEGIEL